MRRLLAALLLFAAGCESSDGAPLPGDAADTRPYAGIGESEVVRLVGTEPFWGGRIEGGTLTYSTPDDIDGTAVPVTRFAGRGGLSFSGTLGGQQVDLAITPGECSDGMSDRTYPFAATLQLGGEQRTGCAWREGIDLLGPAP